MIDAHTEPSQQCNDMVDSKRKMFDAMGEQGSLGHNMSYMNAMLIDASWPSGMDGGQ